MEWKIAMNIVPYKSFGPLMFGQSTKADCVPLLGKPTKVSRNREGIEEFHYVGFIIRFDSSTSTVRECTLLPRTVAGIGDIGLTWDQEFLRRACDRDGSPRNVYGFIVLKNLGIAVTGIHDNDESQLAVTVFSEGDFDDLLAEAVPFECPTSEE
jgi:hypothetical protein